MQIKPIQSQLVHSELAHYTSLRTRLIATLPDIDEETLSDTLEGITELREMLAQVLRSALDDEALSAGLSTRLADMKERVDRFEHRAKKKRLLVLQIMIDAQIEKLAADDLTASLRKGPSSVEIVAEDKIPAAYWKPQPPKLDKQVILSALKNGVEIEGAILGGAQTQLSVRTK